MDERRSGRHAHPKGKSSAFSGKSTNVGNGTPLAWFPTMLRNGLSAFAFVVPAVAIGVALFTGRGAHAEDADVDKAEVAERCAIRLSIALVGKSPDAALLASSDPRSAVEGLLASPDFADRFARFINSEFNGGPSSSATDDPVYYLAKHVIANDKPWTDLFIGPYAITPTETAMEVTDDAEGLGYFRSPSWMKRYGGNEGAGYMLVGAFRILSNTTGLELIPSVGNPGDDRSGAGRKAGACRGCHFDAWYALDTYAKLLPKRKGQGDTMTFTEPTDGPQQLLGRTIADDKDLVSALVDSDAWRFHQCRNVFKFVHGRPENQCEATVFDSCVDALVQQKTLRAAVAAVVNDPTFCR
ncbi:MAG: hypothetical protein K0S65_2345 [Labilithrix sp.]|nr:hypothetical protein [Labilithrix sp.]